jgi:hypothetical protein
MPITCVGLGGGGGVFDYRVMRKLLGSILTFWSSIPLCNYIMGELLYITHYLEVSGRQ